MPVLAQSLQIQQKGYPNSTLAGGVLYERHMGDGLIDLFVAALIKVQGLNSRFKENFSLFRMEGSKPHRTDETEDQNEGASKGSRWKKALMNCNIKEGGVSELSFYSWRRSSNFASFFGSRR